MQDTFLIGDLPRGRVVTWDDSGRVMKVVRQYEGSTIVQVKKPPTTFVPTSGPKAGKVVTIKGGVTTMAVARGTMVRSVAR